MRNKSQKAKQKEILEFIKGFDPESDEVNYPIMSPEVQASLYAASKTLTQLLELQFKSRFWWQFFNISWSILIIIVIALCSIYSTTGWTVWINLASLGLLMWNINSNYNYYLSKKVYVNFLHDRLRDREPKIFIYLVISKASLRHRNR